MERSKAIILSQPYAGLQAQALGLAERAGLILEAPRTLIARRPWRWLPAASWPRPLSAIEPLALPDEGLLLSVGGMGAAVAAAYRRQGWRAVQIQNPRMPVRRFDLVVANTHDELTGPNVLVARTALHRLTPARLAAARAGWAARFASLPRPLVAVLVGGSNGRFRLDAAFAAGLARQLAAMMREDHVGVVLTPSRRTGSEVRRVLEEGLAPLGAWIWDFEGSNPYFGMLACADAIIVTGDSVSMVSEAVATAVPVMVVPLPGRSRRIGLFLRTMRSAGRTRDFAGRLEMWPVEPLDDTTTVAQEMRQRLGLNGSGAGAS